MRDQQGPLADEAVASPQEIASFAQALRIDVRDGKVAAAQQGGELVVLGLAAVNGLEVESVAENERDLVPSAQIGDPVPGEHALAPDDEIVAVGFDCFEEVVGLGDEVLV